MAASTMGRQQQPAIPPLGLDNVNTSEDPFGPRGSTAVLLGLQRAVGQQAVDHFQGLVPLTAVGGPIGTNCMTPWLSLGGSRDLLGMRLPTSGGGGDRSTGGGAPEAFNPLWSSAAGVPFGSDSGIEGSGQGPDLLMPFDASDMGAAGGAFGFDAASDDENGSSQVRIPHPPRVVMLVCLAENQTRWQCARCLVLAYAVCREATTLGCVRSSRA